jgi:hypothetical protein
LDAEKAVSLTSDVLGQHLEVICPACTLIERRGKRMLKVTIENQGALDVEKALVTIFNGDPLEPGAPEATMENPVILVTKQIGHTIGPVRGFHSNTFHIALTEQPGDHLWVQVCTLDRHGSDQVHTVRIPSKILLTSSADEE